MSNLKDYCNKTTLNSRIEFGKYKDMTIDEIGEIDSEYILYLYNKKLINPDEKLEKIIKEL
mgnify:FL=1|jgi:hypothetical protein